MRAIITGGNGLIGRIVAAILAADGYEVVVLSRNPAKVRDLPAGVRAEKWDGRTAAGWGRLADSAEVIINLAGENLSGGLWTSERKRRILQSRRDAGAAIVEAVRSATTKPKLVIQISGIGHYGIGHSKVLTEKDGPGTDFLATVTLDWEAATAPVEELGVRRVVLRQAVVLTPRGGILAIMKLPFTFFVGGKLGSGRQWFPWVHIDDSVRAMRFLMSNEKASGVFNLVSPTPITNAQFTRSLARAMKRPAFMNVPAFALRLVLGELSMTVLEGQRAIPARLTEMGFTFKFTDADAALADLIH